VALRFGTSGVRGLVTEMTDRECWLYTRAFLQYLKAIGSSARVVALAGDYRESTPRILRAVALAVRDEGLEVDFCGAVPTPAILYYGILHHIPSIMVTGSHVPEDRNGIKFNLPWGEVLKSDEAGITRLYEELKKLEASAAATGSGRFDEQGASLPDPRAETGPASEAAQRAYLDRYLSFFRPESLSGAKVVLYEHSSVSRQVLRQLLESLGAQVLPVGRSHRFVAVDTEAVENEGQISQWVKEYGADALVSADGDGDRPLVADETGKIVRGDILGILVAAFLGADTVCAPVSCNTALEICGLFSRVVRTRIGSPFVVEAMQEALRQGRQRVVGFEANGGFLTGSDLSAPGLRGLLRALPTRDAILPILCLLTRSRREGKPISKLLAELPARYTSSGLLRPFDTDRGRAVVETLRKGGEQAAREWFEERFGPVTAMDFTDGARMTFSDGSIVHLRPSGNAPEFRCYTEAASPELAERMNRAALRIVAEKA
jgi:phosphomannomutase